ncbi:glycerate kinase [Nocardia yunnanensis]|uniref:Glycerate kinase n=1 Tax=Nocardia yunnanensis TaxID=2382165 RepID=A0A386ZES0_9NOCA|nr:glycerate kinase [Nocardia yunnanensis]AYF76008.1 glycerate kinase [Nocardia yunnanensis]
MKNPQPRRVLLAPDKFKGSLTAAEAAAALERGIIRFAPETAVRQAPIADGGDGTLDAFVAAGWEQVEIESYGPTLAPVQTSYAVRGATAVIELAAVSGISKLPAGQHDPLHATTYGVGDVIGDALDRGARDIVLGLGGSASTDGGAGMLQALGLRVLDADGNELPCGGAALARAVRIDRSGLHPALADATLTLAGDVDNPLLGPNGAAAVYAAQKGADDDQIANLEAALKNWAAVLGPEWAEKPGAGAAGGAGFGALAALGARMRSGIDVVLTLIDFPAQLADADLVVTGEGSLDQQSLSGKAPIGVCAAARAAGVPVIVVAGRVQLTAEQLKAAGFAAAYALSELEPDPAASMVDAAALLECVGASIVGG